MQTTQITAEGYHEPEKQAAKIAMGGSSVEAIGGIGAVVLAIIGLTGVLPHPLAAIAAIAVGVGLLCQGAAIFSRYSELLSKTNGGILGEAELGGGVTTEFVGGIAGIVLGILALLGITPTVLLPAAVIAFGATLLLTSGETSRLSIVANQEHPDRLHQVTSVFGAEAAGGQVLVGLGAIVLGILGLVLTGAIQNTLMLVGLLCVGASLLFSGTALASRMLTVIRPAI